MVLVCPICNEKNKGGSNYCNQCGHKFPKIVKTKSRKDNSSKEDSSNGRILDNPVFGRVRFP